MRPLRTTVLHLTGRGLTPVRRELLGDLMRMTDWEQRVLHVGDGRPPVGGMQVREMTRTILVDAQVCARRLRGINVQLVHVWSARALALCESALRGVSVLLDCDVRSEPFSGIAVRPRRANREPPGLTHSVIQTVRHTHAGNRFVQEGRPQSASRIRVVCNTESGVLLARRAGFAPRQCALIRPSVNTAAASVRMSRSELRARIGLKPAERVIAIAPLVRPERGMSDAAWGALLVDRVLNDVTLLVPDCGRDTRRVRRLLGAGRRGHVARFIPRGRWGALLPAADVVAYTPRRTGNPDVLAEVMASRASIVASDLAINRELLEHGVSAWLCRPARPAAIASALLRALDQPARSAAMADAAAQVAREKLSRRIALQHYRRLYESLTFGVGRVAVDGGPA